MAVRKGKESKQMKERKEEEIVVRNEGIVGLVR